MGTIAITFHQNHKLLRNWSRVCELIFQYKMLPVLTVKVQRTGWVSRPKFERTIVCPEVTSVWGWSDQRSLPDGNGLIRSQFRMRWSDQRWIQAHISVIKEDFERNWVWSETISIVFFDFAFFAERCWLCQEATKAAFWSEKHIKSVGSNRNQRGPADSKCGSP